MPVLDEAMSLLAVWPVFLQIVWPRPVALQSKRAGTRPHLPKWAITRGRGVLCHGLTLK